MSGVSSVFCGLVWTIGQDGVLYGLNPSSGAVEARATIGTPANHFPTPSVGADLLLRAGSDPFTVAWAGEHHRPTEQWTVDVAVGQALKVADDD